ncbi:hypothetical protein K7I13_10005 [Brucepastera parasyntrophica]|uniref:TDE1717 family outer membrane beta-barrel protein n=1 Tax=Brucepastera parasyntrophica TaxID=2880008 RepID=UPI00210872F2|nr:hypothetical protein [Brucepastera parasyntrophica]ULQ58861.1 hypothetical protein K7I13_10005 [Brucepastera parasyntrophica]
MKKIIAVLACAVLMISGTFAIGLSAGLGGQFDFGFVSTETELLGATSKDSDSSSILGFYGFIDATYVEVDIGMLFDKDDDLDSSLTILNLALYGKYPFKLGMISLYPMLGIDYQICVAMDPEPIGVDKADLNNLWFKLGGGLDINFGRLFVRGNALFGIKLHNKFEKDLIDLMDTSVSSLSIFTTGLDLRLAIGYRFL